MNLNKRYNELLGIGEPALRQKAQNPRGYDSVSKTPSWLALAALNEIVASEEQAKLANGAATEPLPSIKEQLSQKAKGLEALQAKEQQAQQQMVQQAAQAPQPAPEGLPQPEPQPEQPTEPQMMARGGIAKLPVDSRMFDYKEGGIIGFSGVESSEVPEAAAFDTQRVEAAARAKKIKELQAKAKFLRDAGAPQAAQVEAELAALTNPPSKLPVSAPPAGLPSVLPKPRAAMPPQGNVQIPMSPELRAAMEADAAEQGITNPQFNFQGPRGSTATLTKPQQPPQQPPQQSPQQPPQAPAQPAGIATLPAAQEDPLAQAQRFAAAMPKQEKPTFDAVRAERQRALREAGLPEDIGATLKEGIGRYESESERIRNERKEADAIYALSARGGLGEIAERSASRKQINALADTIRNDKANEMRMAMEAARRAEAMGDVAEVRRQTDIYNKAADEQGKAVVTAATQLADTKTKAETQMAGYGIQADTAAKQIKSEEERAKAKDITDRRGQDLHLRAAKLTAAAADVRADKAEQTQKLAELRSLATSFQALIKEPIDPLAKPAEIEAAKKDKAIYRQDYEAVLAAIAKMSGNVSLQSGRGVAPTMDANRASQFKVIR